MSTPPPPPSISTFALLNGFNVVFRGCMWKLVWVVHAQGQVSRAGLDRVGSGQILTFFTCVDLT